MWHCVLTDGSCGKKGLPGVNFVVNNNFNGHWPWMASYGMVNERNLWNHQCGATLISDQHFLTAAHCVQEG
jgi:secreted trypsin-like serine protease